MELTAFQALLEQLDNLTPVQCDALTEALGNDGSSSEVITLIETRFEAAPACGHCASEDFGQWGHASNMRRYKCHGCNRTFNALTGTPLAHLRRRDAWLAYARALVDGVSLRKAAKRANICLDSSFRWRHRMLKNSQNKRPVQLTGIVEADETYILKSVKGSKKLVGRRPRKRGGKAKKPGLSTKEHDCILIVRDRHGDTADYILADLEGATFKARLEPIVAKDAVLVSDCRQAYASFADDHGIWHIGINASKGEHVHEGFHIQNVNAYTARLKDWLRRFRGVASHHLPSYLGWRRGIEREGDAFTPRHCIAQAA
jgi:transposase-like protein